MGQTHAILTRLPPLIGRQAALAEAKALLAQTALLTLAGPGGCGKTRLALELAREVGSAAPDGVWIIELAPVLDATMLPEVVASTLGLHLAGNISPLDELLAFLKPCEALLVCDNCEHLLPACVALVERLLATCPRLRILATSREILNSPLEVACPVPPLAVPDRASCEDAEAIRGSAAVQLFVQRATAALPAFTLTNSNATAVAQICRQLDGLPLAIELAASCVKVLAPQQIAAQLQQGIRLLSYGYRTAAPRQQSLHATIEWSYQLLTPEEQAVFRRLSVLSGAFDLGAAIAVGGGSLDTVLGELRRLVETSLIAAIQQEGVLRYRMLETLRQFGRERLRLAGEEDATFTRYCAWVADLADAPGREGCDPALWLERCEREVDHLRCALRWMVEQQQVEGVLRLAASLPAFWRQRGHIGEGRAWLETILALADDPSHPPVSPLLRARALNGLGVLVMWQADYAQAQAHHEQALSLADAAGDQREVALTLFRLGFLADRRGDYAAATTHLEQSQHIYCTLADEPGADMARNRLGITAWNQGDYERAIAILERSLQFQRRQGHPGGSASTLLNLGLLSLERGEVERATALLHESLAINRALGDGLALTYVHTALGYAALHQQELSRSAQAFADALASLVDAPSVPDILFRLLDGIAILAAHRGVGTPAVRIWSAMAVLRRGHGLAYRSVERQRYRREVMATRSALGSQSFTQAWAEGHATSHVVALNEARTLLSQLANASARTALDEDPSASTSQSMQESTGGRLMRAPATCMADSNDSTASTVAHPSVCSPAPAAYLAMDSQATLRIYGLGQVECFRGERLVTATDLTYTKARELLYFLLQHAPSTKEQIGLALWPDATPDYLRTTFRVVIHHLRHALGPQAWIERQQQYYAFNRSLPYWYDVEAFEAIAHEARRLEPGAPTQAVACLEEAQKLYRGAFWDGMTTSDWIAQEQERLRQIYVDVLLRLGALYQRGGVAREALQIFLRAIECEPYCEEAYRGAMRCYLAVNEPGHAAHVFERLRRQLKDQLGVAPAAETAALLFRPMDLPLNGS